MVEINELADPEANLKLLVGQAASTSGIKDKETGTKIKRFRRELFHPDCLLLVLPLTLAAVEVYPLEGRTLGLRTERVQIQLWVLY